MPPGIFTGEFHRFCCPRFARAAKLHEAKQTFLSCIIPYFFLPISVAKAAFVMRATASASITLTIMLMVVRGLREKKIRRENFGKRILEKNMPKQKY